MSTNTLAFFASSSSSFQPAPYTPSTTASGSRPAFLATRNSGHRAHDSLAIPPAGMDPQATDPDVFFVHPPFTTFPNSHLHPDGLTYSLLADNQEWFLDPTDFASQGNPNPNAISYPPHLEPPRGWCPAKKKDLKERGSEGWPEGEEPRLRCTFCRRTYAGVNAKSMWRRHVFEKHKIAMANRRDGNTDRPRGRGSGKENKHTSSSRSRDDAHDSLISMVVAPQSAPESVSHKFRFRPSKPMELPKKKERERRKESREESLPLTPRQSRKSLSVASEDDSEAEAPTKQTTPPLTPHADISSDPSHLLGESSDGLASTSPAIPHPVIPESPYNPLQTPSFRHSPPRLPSDQPWRFPSPSHPLHSGARDLSLTMLARPIASPIVKGLSSLGASPVHTVHSSPMSAALQSDSASFETPARSNFLFGRPGNRLRFLEQIPSPLSTGKTRSARQRIQSSPLPFHYRTPRSHRRLPSDISDTWLSENCLTSSSSLPLDPSNNDPFSIYDSWPSVGGVSALSPVRLPKAQVEVDSPVLRSKYGVGFGLLEPFGYRSEEPQNIGLDEILSTLKGGNSRLEGKRPAAVAAVTETTTEYSPPSKKRRMSAEITDLD